jgi:hypothetical protein
MTPFCKRSIRAVCGRRDDGTVLVIALLLLVVLGILGVATMVMASLELRMAGNFQHQAHAFEAAEFGIEQALRSPDLATTYTLASPKQVPAAGPEPPVPGSTGDTYGYRLYFDSSAGSTAVPDAAAVGPGVAALHFVAEATGHSLRGATDVHTQSFYLLVPEECAAGAAGCPPLASYLPIRSGWAQQDAE